MYTTLLDAIFSLIRPRVLKRLRSKHAPKSFRVRGKPALIYRLADGVSIVRKSKLLPTASFEALAGLVNETKSKFDKLERLNIEHAQSTGSNKVLGELVKCLHELSSRFELEEILRPITKSPGWNMDAVSKLSTAIRKVGRYHSACKLLLHAATRLPLCKHISVATVPEQFRHPYRIKCRPPSLVEVSARFGPSQGTKHRHGKKAAVDNRILQSTTTAQFQSRLAHVYNNSKVHAEIQLLLVSFRQDPQESRS